MALRSWLANFFGRDPADERKIVAIVEKLRADGAEADFRSAEDAERAVASAAAADARRAARPARRTPARPRTRPSTIPERLRVHRVFFLGGRVQCAVRVAADAALRCCPQPQPARARGLRRHGTDAASRGKRSPPSSRRVMRSCRPACAMRSPARRYCSCDRVVVVTLQP